MRISGPAARHPRMQTPSDPSGTRVFGTFNNCAGGTTPWGTMLTAEENFQNYFAGNAAQGPEAAARKRYGIVGRGRYEAWGRHFDRFNLDKEGNEPNRFGWIVEIDPYDPKSTPVKRTALGRAAHECATHAVSHDGRVAFYSGDDARMEYVYKFVTDGRYDPSRPEANRDLMDSGTLYAARFEANGKMRWLPLVLRSGSADTGQWLSQPGRRGHRRTARRRPAQSDADGSSGGRRSASCQRARLRRADLQREPQARAGRRGQSARQQSLRTHRRDRSAARERQARSRRDRVRLGLLPARRKSERSDPRRAATAARSAPTAGSPRRTTSPSIRKDASGSRPMARTTVPASTTASTRRR